MKEVQIVYDFDGTLTPNPVPFLPILKECGIQESDFYNKIEELKNSRITDVYESWFQAILSFVQESELVYHDVTKGTDDIIFCPGVETWFDNLNKNSDATISHYIVTSGVQEFLYATSIAKYITQIFGVSFIHEKGKLKSIEKLISDKGKVDYIKKINTLNGKTENDCSNLIYIGDGLTDYYAMDFVFHNGGTTILVTVPNRIPEEKLLSVSNFQCEADYRIEKELFSYLLSILNDKE